MELPSAGVLTGDTVDGNVRAVVEKYQSWTAIGLVFDVNPPTDVVGVTFQRALANNVDVT